MQIIREVSISLDYIIKNKRYYVVKVLTEIPTDASKLSLN